MLWCGCPGQWPSRTSSRPTSTTPTLNLPCWRRWTWSMTRISVTRMPSSPWGMPRTTTWPGTRRRNCRSCSNSCRRSSQLGGGPDASFAAYCRHVTGSGRRRVFGRWRAVRVQQRTTTRGAVGGHATAGVRPEGAATGAGPEGAGREFRNVRIFDGHSDKLSAPSNVLVKGNRIDKISTEALPAERGTDITVIDGGGRTLMPGLIDNHWHTMLVRPPVTQLTTSDPGYLILLAGAEANDT